MAEDGSLWKWDVGYDRFMRFRTDAQMVDADDSNDFGVALDENGTPWTWGRNDWGQRGNGTADSYYIPMDADDSVQYREESDGNLFALMKDGTIRKKASWGEDEDRQLGSDNDWAQIAGKADGLYALKRDGSLWFYRDRAKVSPDTYRPEEGAFAPFQQGTAWQKIASSQNGFIVGLRKDGTLWIWGRDAWNAMTSENEGPPVQLGNDRNWKSFSVSSSHALAVKLDGTLWGMGNNRYGQLGKAISEPLPSFVQIGKDANWLDAQAGGTTSIGLRKDGTLWQWGRGFDGKSASIAISQLTKDNDWTRIWNGGSRAFALKRDGSLWAWGDNGYGQLGIGASDMRSVPTRVKGNGPWLDLHLSPFATYGSKADGSNWSWGSPNRAPDEGNLITDLKITPVTTQAVERAPEPAWTVSFVPFSVSDATGRVKTQPGMHVSVSRSNNWAVSGRSDASGNFSFALPKVRDGIYTVHVSNGSGQTLASASYAVGDTTPPRYPNFAAPVAGMTTITGHAEPNSLVYVMKKTGVYHGTTSANGIFTVKLPKLIAGENISIWSVDAVGNRTAVNGYKVGKK